MRVTEQEAESANPALPAEAEWRLTVSARKSARVTPKASRKCRSEKLVCAGFEKVIRQIRAPAESTALKAPIASC